MIVFRYWSTSSRLPNRFSVRLYPFAEKPHDLQVRTWRCHGTFRVTLAHDKNGDGKPEGVFWKRQMKLDRGAFIDLKLPPRQASILSVTLSSECIRPSSLTRIIARVAVR